MLKPIRWKMKNLVSGLSFQEEENRDAKLGSLELDISGLWLPLCQNESLCQTIRMKMCLICSVIFMEIKFIFMSKVLHEESLWNRGKTENNLEMASWLHIYNQQWFYFSVKYQV